MTNPPRQQSDLDEIGVQVQTQISEAPMQALPKNKL